MRSREASTAWKSGGAASALVLIMVACSSDRDDERAGGEADLGQSRSGLTVSSAGDTYLRSGSPNQNQGSLTTLRLQQSGSNRALLKFSDADVASFASGATVTLTLTIATNGDNWDGGRQIAVHRMTRDWDE